MPRPTPPPFKPGPRKTIEPAVLRKQPGEHAAAVTKLAAGTTVNVERQEGRWLRVRVGNAVGYLTRTQIEGADGGPPDSETTGWSASRRGETEGDAAPAAPASTTGMFVEVSAETAPLRTEPKHDGGVVAAVARGNRLAILEAVKTAGWLRARDEQGHEGWIEQAHLANGTAAVALSDVDASGAPTASARATDAPITRQRGKQTVRADAGIGYRSLGMDFTSNGSGGLANYLVSADAPALDVTVDVGRRLSRRLLVGVDARGQLSRSTGIEYKGPTNPSGKIPFSTVSTDAGVRVGTQAKQIFELAVRGGFHYDVFLASDVDNAGMIARERLLGATLGARVDVVPPRSRIAVTGRFDALVIGSRAQTEGLENGTSSTARAFWGGVTIRFQLTGKLSLLSAYDFGSATTEWEGMSVRDPGVTQAKRVDRTQLVQLGISADL